MRTSTVVVCSCTATALAIAGASMTVHDVADARWTEMTAWMAQADAEYRGRDTTRAVAHGAATDEAAFPHYRRALALAQPLLQDHDPLVRLWCQAMLGNDDNGSMPPAEVAAIRTAWAPALAELRAGAHCAQTGPAVDFAAPLQIVSLLAARWLVNLTVLDARAAATAGKGRVAAECLLDALTFGLDLSRSPLGVDRIVGSSVASIVLAQGCADERLAELEREALDLLANGLARLDDDALAHARNEDQVLTEAHYLQQLPASARKDFPEAPWRYGLSERWMQAAAVLGAVAAARVLDRHAEPWPERERLGQELEEGAFATANPLLGFMGMPIAFRSARRLREAQAQLRELRLAVDLRRGAALPSLRDPLGTGPLAIERGADAVRFVSAGRSSNGARIERSVPTPR